MCDRDNQFYMTHALTTDFLLGHFDTATVANDTFVANAFVFTAVAFPVARRAKDTLTEQTIALRFIGAVVDGLGLGHLAIRASFD